MPYTDRVPSQRGTGSYLMEDTEQMMRDQRLDEQAGKRRLAPLHAQQHEQSAAAPAARQGLESGRENDIPQHPYLDKQLFDGADRHMNIDPTNNPNAKVDLENAEREQEMEKQLRLGLQMRPGRYNTPTPGSGFGA